MASKEVKQKLQRCLMNRRSFKRTETEREKAHVSELNSQHENPNTPPSSHPRGKQLWRTDHSSGSSCTKCQYSPPTAQSDHTPQLWDKSVQPYHQMDRNVNVIGPVEMWIQHPLTHSHENMLQRFILLKHVYIEVNPQLAVLQGDHSSGSSCTKCQYSPPTAQSDHTPQLWDKSVQPYHQMDRNVNVIGPVEMWIQHPLTHSHENMLQRFILLKHVYIEVNPQLAVLQGACVSVRQHRPLHRCHSQPLILNEQPCGFYQCRSVQRPKRLLHTHKTIPTRVCVIHQEQHHLQAEKRTEEQEKGDVEFIVGEDHSIVLQEELCEDSSQLSPSSKQWLCRPKLGLQSRSHQRLTHTHSCPSATATATADSAPDFALRTGLMYDPQMLKQQCICGNSSCRTEHAGKVPRVFARLQECGVSNQCKWISGKQGSMEYQSSLFALAVKTAAACVTDLLLRVAQGRLKNGFAIVQTHGPDASHSSPSKSVVHPVAVAAEHLLKKLNNRKILILDWDVHHCHTTPKIFYKDPNILHISLHCYGNTTPGATPMSGAGQLDEVDLGDGNGFNVNVEWSCDLDPPIGDAEYLAAFRTVIRPIARQFSPEIILISTEFNTAEGHPESCRGPRVSAKCFGLLTQSLMELSGGHVVLVLERGHDHPAVCEASAACVNALLQNKVETLSEYVLIKKPCAAAVQSLHRVLQVHSQYWSSMRDLTHTIGESWLQAEGKHSAQTDTASALASLSMTTPNYPGVSYPEMFGLCGGGNEPVEHDEDEDEDEGKTLM